MLFKIKEIDAQVAVPIPIIIVSIGMVDALCSRKV